MTLWPRNSLPTPSDLILSSLMLRGLLLLWPEPVSRLVLVRLVCISNGTLSLSMPNCLLLKRKNSMSGKWQILIKLSHPKTIKASEKERKRTSFIPRNSFHPWFPRRSSLPLTKNQRRRRGRMTMQPTSCPLFSR